MDVPSDIYAVGRHACTPTQMHGRGNAYTPMDAHTYIIHNPINARIHIYGFWLLYLAFQQHHYQHCFMTHLL